MTEWIMIAVTSNPMMIEVFGGQNVKHLTGFKTEQGCKRSLGPARKIMPNTSLECVPRRDFKRWKPKPS